MKPLTDFAQLLFDTGLLRTLISLPDGKVLDMSRIHYPRDEKAMQDLLFKIAGKGEPLVFLMAMHLPTSRDIIMAMSNDDQAIHKYISCYFEADLSKGLAIYTGDVPAFQDMVLPLIEPDRCADGYGIIRKIPKTRH